MFGEEVAHDIPIFLMGDFNSMPHNSANFIFRGEGLNYNLEDDIDPYVRSSFQENSELFN